LKASMGGCTQEFSEDEHDEMFKVLGTVPLTNYSEWMAATMDPSIALSWEGAKWLFNFLDSDGDGKISHRELRSVVGDEATLVIRAAGRLYRMVSIFRGSSAS